MHVRKEHVLSLLAILVTWGVYAGPLLSPRTSLFLSDTFCFDVPNYVYAAQMCLSGQLPTWTSDLRGGFPMLAGGQVGVAYPLFSLFLWAPRPETIDLFVALHFLMAGVFMYLFLFQVVRDQWGAACGAITFMTGTYLQSGHVVPGIVVVTAWLPLALYCLFRWSEGSRTAAWWCGAVNGTAILVGELNIMRVSLALQVIYFLWSARNRPFQDGLKAVALVFVLPIALAAVQVLPLYLYARESTRLAGTTSALSWKAFCENRLEWLFLLTFFHPDLWGTPWEPKFQNLSWEENFIVFHGFAAVILVPLGLWYRRRRVDTWFWFVVLVVGALLATASPLYRCAYYLPVYNWFRYPARQFLISVIALSVLCACGGTGLIEQLRRWRGWGASRLMPGLVAPVIVACCAWGGLYRNMAAYVTNADFYQIHSEAIVTAAHRNEHFRLRPLTWALFGYENASEATLRRNVYCLPANYNLLFAVPSATSIGQELGTVSARGPTEVLDLRHENSLKLCGVTHFSSAVPVEALYYVAAERPLPEYLPPADALEQLPCEKCYFYRYRHAMPRAWMVYDVRHVPDAAERLKLIASDDFDPGQAAIVETEVALGPAPTRSPRIRLVEPTPKSLVLDVETDNPGLLVIADTYSADFVTLLDGQSVELLRTNHAFRGVRVPAGKHRIEMRHRPRAVWIGGGISIAAVLFTTVGLWRCHRASGHPQRRGA